MIGPILLDTGPLIAILDTDSRQHEWASDVWKTSLSPALTCEAVLTETVFLLEREKMATAVLFELLESGSLKIGLQVSDHIADINALMKRYKNRPMSLADACLVRLSELHSHHRVVTFDSDFKIYRKHGNKMLATLMPGE